MVATATAFTMISLGATSTSVAVGNAKLPYFENNISWLKHHILHLLKSTAVDSDVLLWRQQGQSSIGLGCRIVPRQCIE